MAPKKKKEAEEGDLTTEMAAEVDDGATDQDYAKIPEHDDTSMEEIASAGLRTMKLTALMTKALAMGVDEDDIENADTKEVIIQLILGCQDTKDDATELEVAEASPQPESEEEEAPENYREALRAVEEPIAGTFFAATRSGEWDEHLELLIKAYPQAHENALLKAIGEEDKMALAKKLGGVEAGSVLAIEDVKPETEQNEESESQPDQELLSQVRSVFGGHDFAKQPKFLVDGHSTDGSLLSLVFDFIRSETPRGSALQQYPITLVGISLDEDSQAATNSLLDGKDVLHKVLLLEDVPDPIAMQSLVEAGVDLKQSLVVRALAYKSRSYAPPTKIPPQDSACAQFARDVLGDTAHHDQIGNRILGVDIFSSLAEHLEQWAFATKGGAGICMSDAFTSSALPIESSQSLGRDHTVPPLALHLAASMAGLHPVVPSMVGMRRTHDFKIRLAEAGDIEKLMEIESQAWEEHLRASREGILKRLRTSPTTCFVATIEEQVVGVLYTQRINDLSVVSEEKFQQVSDWHDPQGPIIQLIAINVNPSFGSLGLAQHLRAFALRFAQLEPTIESVCAVTLCREYKNYDGTMADYMKEHAEELRTDPVVNFHTGFGAQFVSLVPAYRPEDFENDGIGILVHYDLTTVLAPIELAPLHGAISTRVEPEVLMLSQQTIQLIRPIFEAHDIEVNQDMMSNPLISAEGLDSLLLVQIRNQIAGCLSLELPTAFFFDYPTLDSACERLDEIRGVLEHQQINRGTDQDQTELGRVMRTYGAAYDAGEMDRKEILELLAKAFPRDTENALVKAIGDEGTVALCKKWMGVEVTANKGLCLRRPDKLPLLQDAGVVLQITDSGLSDATIITSTYVMRVSFEHRKQHDILFASDVLALRGKPHLVAAGGALASRLMLTLRAAVEAGALKVLSIQTRPLHMPGILVDRPHDEEAPSSSDDDMGAPSSPVGTMIAAVTKILQIQVKDPRERGSEPKHVKELVLTTIPGRCIAANQQPRLRLEESLQAVCPSYTSIDLGAKKSDVADFIRRDSSRRFVLRDAMQAERGQSHDPERTFDTTSEEEETSTDDSEASDREAENEETPTMAEEATETPTEAIPWSQIEARIQARIDEAKRAYQDGMTENELFASLLVRK